jgi:DNA replication protein DnaC
MRQLIEETFRDLRVVPAEYNLEQPPCPICKAPALAGYLWASPLDLAHDCDCVAEREDGYFSALYQLWAERINRRNFIESLPARYQAFTLDTLDGHDGNRAAIGAAESLEFGQNLYVWGEAGNGKTHLAVGIGRRMVGTYTVAFWGVSHLFQVLREAIGDNSVRRPDLITPHVLVLDDLGKTKPTEWVYENLYNTLERRWADGRSTVFTANYRPLDVAKRISFDKEGAEAVVSRLASGKVVQVKGPDRRLGGGK